MKTLLITVILLIVAFILSSCSTPTSQQSQNLMYSGVWQPQAEAVLMGGRVRSIQPSGRYYGAKDFFNQ
jgi:outer membrane biogenesis lipoprotein LolB